MSVKLKNCIINGDMRISQRGTSFVAVSSNSYLTDRFIYTKNNTAVHTATQDTNVPTFAQSGYLFQNSLRFNLTTPDTTIAAGDVTFIKQHIEGFNFTPLAQKAFTMSFWVKATLVGTYCVAFLNVGNDRSFVAEYTVNTTDTWEYKTITVAASPSAGTWNYTNSRGLQVTFTLAAGTTFQTTAGAWQTGEFYATANQVNGVNTGATDFRITGVCLNEGTQAIPFETFAKDYNGERDACLRYYEKSSPDGTGEGSATNSIFLAYSAASDNIRVTNHYSFSVEKRATPTIRVYNSSGVVGQADLRPTGGSGSQVVVSTSQTPKTFGVAQTGTGTGLFLIAWASEAEL